MRNRSLAVIRSAVLVFAACSLAPGTVGGQTTEVPRHPDGRPDLSGVWNFSTATPMQRPEELADKQVLTSEKAAEYEQQVAERRAAGDSTSETASAESRVSYEQAIWFEQATSSPTGARRWSSIHRTDAFRPRRRRQSAGAPRVATSERVRLTVRKTATTPNAVSWGSIPARR